LWDYLIGDPDNFKKNSFENRWRLNEMTGTGIQSNAAWWFDKMISWDFMVQNNGI
jgi:hypothetical protein